MAGEDQRRQFQALTDLGAPTIDLARDAARLQRVDADLVKPAELARFEFRRERRRQKDLALLADDKLADIRRPAFELGRFSTHFRAFLEALIRPDMNDLIQRPDFGVPEGGERRQFGPCRQGLAEAVLDRRDRTGLHFLSAEFDNHRGSSIGPRRVGVVREAAGTLDRPERQGKGYAIIVRATWLAGETDDR